MRRRRKKADLRIVIRDEEIKIRKTAVRPGQAHQNKKLYSRRNEKRCYEEIPGHDWPGISLYGGMARSWYAPLSPTGTALRSLCRNPRRVAARLTVFGVREFQSEIALTRIIQLKPAPHNGSCILAIEQPLCLRIHKADGLAFQQGATHILEPDVVAHECGRHRQTQ